MSKKNKLQKFEENKSFDNLFQYSYERIMAEGSFVNPWTVAHQAPLSQRISQARIMEWVTISFSGEASQHSDGTRLPCISRQILLQ